MAEGQNAFLQIDQNQSSGVGVKFHYQNLREKVGNRQEYKGKASGGDENDVGKAQCFVSGYVEVMMFC
ncbi:hypothetical protein [Erwinia persicina]|uniref:hypothetical protein n=1 Tax=Erwinia persicina TaxID=55211 RepID=UPI00187591BE|nr:hypothetical protein [Erwinia persicina]